MTTEKTGGASEDMAISPIVSSSALVEQLTLPTVHSDLLTAHRDIVKSSEFRNALESVQNFLEEIPAEPKPLSHIEQASTKEEMEDAIVREGSLNYDGHPSIKTWVSSIEGRDMLALTSPAIAGFGVSGGASILYFALGAAEILGVTAEGYLTVGLVGGLLVGFLWLMFLAVVFDTKDQKVVFAIRNKVLRRKAYKREVTRLMGVAEDARERYERIVAIRKSKISAVKKAIAPVADDFALSNPGKTLGIVSKDSNLTLGIVRAEGYSHLDSVAARVISGLPINSTE